jgi:hypothetical protein
MDKTNYVVTTYIDGTLADTNGATGNCPQVNGGSVPGPVNLNGLGSFIQCGDPTIGNDPGCTEYWNLPANNIAIYNMDDVAIWRRLLTSNEVAAIYTAGQSGQSFGSVIVGLTITPVSGGVQINWPSGTLWSSSSLTGPWNKVTNATPPSYTAAAAGTALFYRVQ